MNEFDELEIVKIDEKFYNKEDIVDEPIGHMLDGSLSLYEHDDELSCVESYAEDNDLISSEGALSDRFDEFASTFPSHLYEDYPAMREEFNNYVDMLSKDGEIHELQANNYCYVGNAHKKAFE